MSFESAHVGGEASGEFLASAVDITLGLLVIAVGLKAAGMILNAGNKKSQ